AGARAGAEGAAIELLPLRRLAGVALLPGARRKTSAVGEEAVPAPAGPGFCLVAVAGPALRIVSTPVEMCLPFAQCFMTTFGETGLPASTPETEISKLLSTKNFSD